MEILKLSEIPICLQSIKYPPKELFYKGNISLLQKPSVSIVGTRKPMQYTRRVIYTLARDLAKAGIVVVSGGAIGTDILAHEASFPNTIGVMANSLDYIYPKINSKLLTKMSEEALLISEYEKDIPADPRRFIHRNRLIVGLSQVLIVSEADLNSGTFRSMEIAKREGREIFVLPHRLGESLGTQLYLELGIAKQISDIDNFIENISALLGADIQNEATKQDPVLEFCKDGVEYEVFISEFGDVAFEYELEGKVEIRDGIVYAKK
jgi:DNA processing protein